MENNNRIANTLTIISLIGLVYCFVAFSYVQPLLKPSLAEPTATMNTIGNLVLPVYVVAGLYHIILLINALKAVADSEKSAFVDSFYIVLLILSGITLLSDVTILSDIGKEYRYWDVYEQWLILYGSTFLHLAVVIYGTLFRRKHRTAGKNFFEEIRSSSDAMFLSMNQVCLICGCLGIAGAVFSMSGMVSTVITKRYEVAYMLLLSGLAIFPVILFAVYWFVRSRKKPLSGLLDEKQILDTASGALVSVVIDLPLIVIFIILSLGVADLQAAFWLALIFFVHLVALSATVLVRNRTSD